MWWSESESHSVMSNSLQPYELYSPWNSPGQNAGVGSLSLLWGIFPIQGSKPGLPCCRRILYQHSHYGSQRILKWVANPFSRGSSQPRNWTGVFCIAGGFFTNWAIEENPYCGDHLSIPNHLCCTLETNMLLYVNPISPLHTVTQHSISTRKVKIKTADNIKLSVRMWSH